MQRLVTASSLVSTKGKFDEKQTRSIIFLDTPDHTLRRNGLVLRRRALDEVVEYTLKCRSEDRYFAAGTDVAAAEGLDAKQKLEKDIAPPFRCRFSHSATITVPGNGKAALAKRPKRLGEASALFPLLSTLHADGLPCAPKTALEIVHNIKVDESVWKGGKFAFTHESGETEKATVAVILWSRGKGRPVATELSFRIKDSKERFSREPAGAARAAYQLLQRLDCARPHGLTKTEYIYRDWSRD